ncbi:Fe-S cluster assembly sulfur transfer protein SufU [Lacticaseibacillus nasuensis]|uniref:Fe-S cluster formation protein, NifU-like n=1 Tax=Lacticaseibacillus nasuensis JCM 17158 TaxID=1291734 RepID=A0A0R1JS82_9LACO|nr:SUF system NifU family Fe-S cluster assembly protein [Lacticaseibacillus nasuensis]KRK74143.1 Fe-S cluster formation protein, NifU-like [Lacticaseibacillus nasuensis JCM 17158]
MALTKLDQLYRQVILDEAYHPRHHGKLSAPDRSVTLRNPSCGDVLTLQLQVAADRVTDAKFSGSGCTISQASGSLMTDLIIGRQLSEIPELVGIFSDLVINGSDPREDQLGDAAILKGVHQFPARVKCATLAWKAAAQAVEGATDD